VKIALKDIVLMVPAFACTAMHVNQQNEHFEVLHATSQEWIAGVHGGGKGINYKVSIKIITDKKVDFDSIWVAGRKLNIKPEKGPGLKLAKNDIVTLLASDYRGSSGTKGNKEEEKINPPFDIDNLPFNFEGAALMRYLVDGSEKYLEIAQIKVLPPIHGQ
jgi:hypothetical protein